MIVRRQADYKLKQIIDHAPVEYDTFVEIAEAIQRFEDQLSSLRTKLDLITVTQAINLDTATVSGSSGTVADFEEQLQTNI